MDMLVLQRLIASSDPNDRLTDFAGSTRLKMGITPSGVYVDRPIEETSATVTRSATVPGSLTQSSMSYSPLLISQGFMLMFVQFLRSYREGSWP